MEMLASGKLINNASEKEDEYSIIRLDKSWLDRLLELQTVVMKHMDKKELFAGLTRDEFLEVLDTKGITVGALVEERLIGFYSVLFPGLSDYNLGNDIGLDKEKLDSVVHMEGAGIDPDYRGNSLQKVMVRVCLDEALKLGKTRYICATVSPYNYPSIDHIFAMQLCIKKIKPKYNGVIRYICVRDIKKGALIDNDSIIEVPGDGLEKQAELLDKGYLGFGQLRCNEKNLIRFGKTVN